MGVNGLTRLLEEGGRPRVVTYASGEGHGQVVVVDASAVEVRRGRGQSHARRANFYSQNGVARRG